ncbi:Autoinducer 2 sensor kinase/phosphatase LuxQ [Caulifigura coniformis]|uniref:histidine kinase n=1 Tax=Caulifigura coniformis TaxID=2527983 RepID=A0A517SBV0_9PLAN|nr:ATP-binding protein [Caulifigura coniformis]QDT53620.1 Autoinducer 2 sensor kinase/phosphatase LuxQ [Caulifigura coniformis]
MPSQDVAGAASNNETARLRAEVASLRLKLAETTERLEVAESTVHAIRAGEVDAVVVQDQDHSRVFTLAAPEKFYLQLAQELANVGTWDLDFQTGQITLSAGQKQFFGLDESGPASMDDLWPRIAEEDRERIQQKFEEARNSGSLHFYQEFRVVGVDDSVRWLAAKGTVINGPHGERVRLVGINIDITERKAIEQALFESEKAFRELADSMPQIVWMARPDGSVEYFNRRWYEFTGEPDAVASRELRLGVVHPDDRARAQAAWDTAVRTEAPLQVEYRFRESTTGRYRWHLGRALPIRDEAGRVRRWFGTATDIHDQKILQDTLREADHRKDQFLAMLAHELRNPLSPLMIAADLIAAESSISPHIREMAEVMARQTTQLKRLIDDLLDVSRITTGRLELRRDRVDLREAIDAALDVSRPLIDSSGHTLNVWYPPEPVFIEGDKVRLTQVVGNLLINAAKYTPAAGQIDLTVVTENSRVVITVADNGIGIPKAMLSHVFDLFTQVDSSTTRSQSGLGIGLTLVRTLVEMHGGEVSAQSEGHGSGSRFVVSLPAMDAAGGQLRSGPSAEGKATSRRRVLIIDDNQSASYLLGKLLSKLEQDVRVEQSATQALQCLDEFRPDIVISDIAMPDVSGHELARRIRNTSLVRQPILVALTGYGQEDDRQASMAAGFDMHITKPIDIATLKAILQTH